MMPTANDLLCAQFAARGLRMRADIQLPAVDAVVVAHLAGNVIEGVAPTLAEFRAAEAAYPVEVAKSAALRRKAEIIAELSRLDLDSIRALRARSAGKGRVADDTKLATLDAQADALRDELAALGV